MCVCVCVCVCERERERDRETETETEKPVTELHSGGTRFGSFLIGLSNNVV